MYSIATNTDHTKTNWTVACMEWVSLFRYALSTYRPQMERIIEEAEGQRIRQRVGAVRNASNTGILHGHA